MIEDIVPLILIVITFLGYGALAMGAALMANKVAREGALKTGAYVVAALAGCLALIMPLLMILSAGVYETTEGNSNSVIDCGNFPNQRSAQAFYEAVQDSGVNYRWLDLDRDGVACESDDQ